jgi:hypothetical protein
LNLAACVILARRQGSRALTRLLQERELFLVLVFVRYLTVTNGSAVVGRNVVDQRDNATYRMIVDRRHSTSATRAQ